MSLATSGMPFFQGFHCCFWAECDKTMYDLERRPFRPGFPGKFPRYRPARLHSSCYRVVRASGCRPPTSLCYDGR